MVTGQEQGRGRRGEKEWEGGRQGEMTAQEKAVVVALIVVATGQPETVAIAAGANHPSSR